MLYTFSIIILWLLEKNYYIGNFFISDNVLEFLSKKLFLRSCDVIFWLEVTIDARIEKYATDLLWRCLFQFKE